MEKQEDAVIEIDEVEETPEVEEFSIDGLMPEEVEMAKDSGLYVEKEEEDGEHEEQPEDETEEDSENKDEDEDEEVENPTFEDVEKNEKLVDKYNKNEKALYWKWKSDKQKRQDAQKKAQELEDKLKEAIDSGASAKKLQKIKALLEDTDSLTVEALQAAIDENIEEEKKDNDLDNAKVIQNKVATKAMFAEKIGSAKYDNFDAISNLAKEVMSEDASGTYQKLIDESFLNDDIDENMLVERVVNIARMSPKFGEVSNQVKPEKKEVEDRVLKNSKKKVSSASISGASGKRIISESELTPEQASKLTPAQWEKLKPETKQRILMS